MPVQAAHWVIHCDGSAVPNPGRMGLGAVLIAPDGVTQYRLSEATTFTGCNNEAELRALLRALQWLDEQMAAHVANAVVYANTTVQIYSDSRVLVEQLGTPTVAPIERLAPLVDTVRRALQPFQQVALQWIPRHRNGAADALARAALGLASKVSAPHGQKIKKRHRS